MLTRHFRLMSAGKLQKDPKGIYIVNQTPDHKTGGTDAVPESNILTKLSIVTCLFLEVYILLAFNKKPFYNLLTQQYCSILSFTSFTYYNNGLPFKMSTHIKI